MTTLIIITLIFFITMVITFALGILFTCSEIRKKVVEFPKVITVIGMASTLGLILSIISLITFYNVLP